MLYIFVDTNFFIQCKPYDHLPWENLFKDHISIIIPRTVISEIDKHKSNPEKRKQKRAKACIPLLRELRDINHPKEFCNKQYSKKISIIEHLDGTARDQQFLQSLDLTNNDDRIIKEILLWKTKYNEDNFILFSADVGITMKCQDFEIQYTEIPDEWLLPPETDERDKKIKLLEDQLRKEPKTSIKIENKPLKVEIPVYKPLSQDDLDNLKTLIMHSMPMQTTFQTDPKNDSGSIKTQLYSSFSLGFQTPIVYPSDKMIDEYKTSYQEWINNLLNKFRNAHTVKTNERVLISFKTYFINEGGAPAKDLEITLTTNGGALLLHHKLLEDFESTLWGIKELDIPYPPEIPIARLQITTAPLFPPYSNYPNIPRAQYTTDKPEPNTFYYKEQYDEPSKELRFRCSELRHGVGDIPFYIYLLIPESGFSKNLSVDIKISISNQINVLSEKIILRPIEQKSDKLAENISKEIKKIAEENNKKEKERKKNSR